MGIITIQKCNFFQRMSFYLAESFLFICIPLTVPLTAHFFEHTSIIFLYFKDFQQDRCLLEIEAKVALGKSNTIVFY